MIKLLNGMVAGISHRLGFEIRRLTKADEGFLEQQRLCARIPAPVIFDVGAYHGETALRYARLFPTATIHAFEPFPKSYRILREQTNAHARIRTFNLGLADAAGKRSFHTNRSAATNSLRAIDPRSKEFWATSLEGTNTAEMLDFTTLDRFVAEHGLDRIDVLKLDVQGTEDLVLSGAERLIRERRIGLVYMEVLTVPAYEGQKALHEMFALMDQFGFEAHNFYDLSCDNGKLLQFDALFVARRPGE